MVRLSGIIIKEQLFCIGFCDKIENDTVTAAKWYIK